MIMVSLEVHVPLVMVHSKIAELPAASPVTVVMDEHGMVILIGGLITDQQPVPGAGSFAFKLNVPLLQFERSCPAFAGFEVISLVKTTRSNDGAHVLLVIVHCRVAEVPAGIPVTVVLNNPVLLILAVPLTNDHIPVPDVGLFAARVNVLLLHCDWSDPALEVVGKA